MFSDIFVDQDAVGRELRADAALFRVRDQFENVGAQQGFAAAEDHHPDARICELIEQIDAFLVGQIGWGRLGDRRRVAVWAMHVAVHTDVPDHDRGVSGDRFEAPRRASAQVADLGAAECDFDEIGYRKHLGFPEFSWTISRRSLHSLGANPHHPAY